MECATDWGREKNAEVETEEAGRLGGNCTYKERMEKEK